MQRLIRLIRYFLFDLAVNPLSLFTLFSDRFWLVNTLLKYVLPANPNKAAHNVIRPERTSARVLLSLGRFTLDAIQFTNRRFLRLIMKRTSNGCLRQARLQMSKA